MPRLGRFLYGSWLRTESLEGPEEDGGAVRFGAGYRDGWGSRHIRKTILSATDLRIVDELSGFKTKAMLRWRLMPGPWTLVHNGQSVRVVAADGHSLALSVFSDLPIIEARLVEGWESLRYYEKQPLPVLEMSIAGAGLVQRSEASRAIITTCVHVSFFA